MCHFILVRGASWPGSTFFKCFLIYSLLSLVHKYGYVSNHVKAVSLTLSLFFFPPPDLPFLDNELIYVTSEHPELVGSKLGSTDFCEVGIWCFSLIVKHRWYKKHMLLIKMLSGYQRTAWLLRTDLAVIKQFRAWSAWARVLIITHFRSIVLALGNVLFLVIFITCWI